MSLKNKKIKNVVISIILLVLIGFLSIGLLNVFRNKNNNETQIKLQKQLLDIKNKNENILNINYDVVRNTKLENVDENNIWSLVQLNSRIPITQRDVSIEILNKSLNYGKLYLRVSFFYSRWESEKRYFVLEGFKPKDTSLVNSEKTKWKELVMFSFLNQNINSKETKLYSANGFLIDASYIENEKDDEFLPSQKRKLYFGTNAHFAKYNSHTENLEEYNFLKNQEKTESFFLSYTYYDDKNKKTLFKTIKTKKPKTIFLANDFLKTKPNDLNPNINANLEEIADFAVLEVEIDDENAILEILNNNKNFLQTKSESFDGWTQRNDPNYSYINKEKYYIKDNYQEFGFKTTSINQALILDLNFKEKDQNQKWENYINENLKILTSNEINNKNEDVYANKGFAPYSNENSYYADLNYSFPNETLTLGNKTYKTQGLISSWENMAFEQGSSGSKIGYNEINFGQSQDGKSNYSLNLSTIKIKDLLRNSEIDEISKKIIFSKDFLKNNNHVKFINYDLIGFIDAEKDFWKNEKNNPNISKLWTNEQKNKIDLFLDILKVNDNQKKSYYSELKRIYGENFKTKLFYTKKVFTTEMENFFDHYSS